MKTWMHALALAASFLATAALLEAQLTIGNVRAAQRPGTKLVDIDYDLTGAPRTVWLEISSDGGATWSVAANSVTGAVGGAVTPGTNLRMTWDAGADWNGRSSSQMRFRVKASDLLPDIDMFATIQSGSFKMGDTLDGFTDAPAHDVALTAYYILKTEVTYEFWSTVRNWAASHGYPDLPVAAGTGPNYPTTSMSWMDAVKWCNAASEKDGLTPCYYADEAQTTVLRSGSPAIGNAHVKWSANGYRLPTEAEWEYAARGGVEGLRFPWGNTISHSQANYYAQPGVVPFDVSPSGGYHPTYGGPSPAGAFAANGFGVFDMSGNLWEMCWDWYGATYYESSPAIDPQGPNSGTMRVMRGGSYASSPLRQRIGARYYDGSEPPRAYAGFRIVRR